MNLFEKVTVKRVLQTGVFLLASSVSVFAQSADTVTIKFDDGDGITGELIEATNTDIRLNTLMGAVTIPIDGVTCIGAVCPEAIRFKTDEAPISLTANDGTVRIVGNFLKIVDGQYVLATEVGELRLSTVGVACEGEACPEIEVEVEFGGAVVLVNGTTEIKGILTGIEDDAYLVDVDGLGVMRVSSTFTCTGDGCPSQ